MQIKMIRSDIKWLRFIIQTPDGEQSEIPFTNIYFTVKSSTRNPVTLIQKTMKNGQVYRLADGDYQIKIAAAETKKLLPGLYKFDIQIVYKDLIKESFPGDLIIEPEITNEEDEEEEEGQETAEEGGEEEQDVIVVVHDYYVIQLATPAPVIDAIEDHGPIPTEELEELTGGANADEEVP